MAAIRPCLGCGEMSAMDSDRLLCAACEPEPEPTIPLTQVEAMLRETYAVAADLAGGSGEHAALSGMDEWITKKIKEARQ